MREKLDVGGEGRVTRVAIYLLFATMAGCITNSEVIVSDVEMGEEANEGEMSVAELLANGKYAEAEQLAKDKGYHVIEDAGRGYRRVVASPKPQSIVPAPSAAWISPLPKSMRSHLMPSSSK